MALQLCGDVGILIALVRISASLRQRLLRLGVKCNVHFCAYFYLDYLTKYLRDLEEHAYEVNYPEKGR